MSRNGRIDRRPGFTLVELLVVLALMIVLLGLAAAVSQSGAFGSQQVISAADRASQWLLIAKQRAMRDRAPRGVRFVLSTTTPPNVSGVREAQYIEAPDPWVPNPNQEGNPNGPRIVFAYQVNPTNGVVTSQQAFFISTDPTTSAADLADFAQRVFAGDMLILPEYGMAYRINTISSTLVPVALGPATPAGSGTPVMGYQLALGPSSSTPSYPYLGGAGSAPVTPPAASLVTYKFAFQPAPRPLLGEPMLQLAGNAIIDVQTAAPFTSFNTPGATMALMLDKNGQYYFDVLFSPSGQVMYNAGGLICLWVHDPDKTPNPRLPDDYTGFNNAGEQSLVTVYVRSGLIATHPVVPPPPPPSAVPYDPYQFAKDGMNSGL